MKTTNVYIRSGVVCAVIEELPKEPKQEDFVSYTDVGDIFHNDDYHSHLYAYREALQRIKDNAVPFEDQPLVAMKIHEAYRKNVPVPDEAVVSVLKDDTFYPLSVEVEIVLQTRHGVEWHDLPGQSEGREQDGIYQKVARIKEPVVEQTAKSDKYLLIPVYADNGEHGHFALIESQTGVKVWSEDPDECKAQGYPVTTRKVN